MGWKLDYPQGLPTLRKVIDKIDSKLSYYDIKNRIFRSICVEMTIYLYFSTEKNKNKIIKWKKAAL